MILAYKAQRARGREREMAFRPIACEGVLPKWHNRVYTGAELRAGNWTIEFRTSSFETRRVKGGTGLETLMSNGDTISQGSRPRAELRIRKCLREIGVAVFLVVCAGVMLAGTAWAQTVNIEGTYDVYERDYSVNRPWTTLTIYGQTGDEFSIKGEGWTGHGTIHWLSGGYDWTMGGKTRHTAIVVRTDGTIDGSVRDKDNPGPKFNWDFVAKRQVKAMAASNSECDRMKKEVLPTCEHKATPQEQYTCKNDAEVRWLRCLDSIPH